MTIIASILFLAAIMLSILTIATTFKSSMPRVIEIIENHNGKTFSAPTVRIGDIKHYKMTALKNIENITSTSHNIIELPLSLTTISKNKKLEQAA